MLKNELKEKTIVYFKIPGLFNENFNFIGLTVRSVTSGQIDSQKVTILLCIINSKESWLRFCSVGSLRPFILMFLFF